MDYELAVQVLVPLVLGMHSHSRIAQHRLNTSGGYNDLFVTALHLVCELNQYTELHLVLVSGNRQESTTWDINFNISQGLGHFATMRVPHHWVQIDFLERQLAQQLLAKEHHASHPEEENVMTRLQQRCGIEGLQILGFVWPAKYGEGKDARAEPRVQDIFVLLEYDLAGVHSEPFGCLVQSFCLAAGYDPVLLIIVLKGKTSTTF